MKKVNADSLLKIHLDYRDGEFPVGLRVCGTCNAEVTESNSQTITVINYSH